MSAAPLATRFILIETSHAGNVGGVARAMRTMGFNDLVLVAPRWPDVLRREETRQRASGALDVLEGARIVATLDEALDGLTHLCATAMVARDFGPPTVAPREHLQGLLAQPGWPGGVGFLFGSERYGMRNEDVYRCHAALRIPVDPGFGSLNLAAAVQVIAYEWRLALGWHGEAAREAPGTRIDAAASASGNVNPAAGASRSMNPAPDARGSMNPTADARGTSMAPAADAQEVAGMLAHWEEALTAVGYLDPAAPRKLMPRLQQLFNRAQPSVEEIHILRGIARAMQKAAKGN